MKVLIVMGVSGSGKSTIGQMLAEALQLEFYEGDKFHPEANRDKMKAHKPLTNEDRKAWIESLVSKINENGKSCVASCSALNDTIRQWIEQGVRGTVQYICLHGSRELLAKRLNARKGHFFPPILLDSQLEAMELPEEAVFVDIDAAPEDIIQDILKQIGN